MAAQKPVWGIRAQLAIPYYSPIESTFSLYLFIDVAKKGEFFASNPALRQIIALYESELKGKKIGWISVLVSHQKKFVKIKGLFPFQDLPENLRAQLKGIGIASQLELKILQLMRKKFPRYRVIARPASKERENQLRKMGREAERLTPFDEAIQKTQAYVVKGAQQWRENLNRRRV